jgi:hypothetical protein
MPNYLVECYLPRAGVARDAGRRVRLAAEGLSRDGVAVRYLRMTLLPDDETCFYLFEADSPDAVEEVSRRADLRRFRVVSAVVDHDADPASSRSHLP